MLQAGESGSDRTSRHRGGSTSDTPIGRGNTGRRDERRPGERESTLVGSGSQGHQSTSDSYSNPSQEDPTQEFRSRESVSDTGDPSTSVHSEESSTLDPERGGDQTIIVVGPTDSSSNVNPLLREQEVDPNNPDNNTTNQKQDAVPTTPFKERENQESFFTPGTGTANPSNSNRSYSSDDSDSIRTSERTIIMATNRETTAPLSPLDMQVEGLETQIMILESMITGMTVGPAKTSLERRRDKMSRLLESHKKSAELARRERSTPLFTTLPSSFGDTNSLPDAKTYSIPNFSGKYDITDKKSDKIPCLNWLQRVIDTAVSNSLSETATIQLLDRHSGGEVMIAIDDAKREGLPLSQIVHQLESRFGGVINADQAHYQMGSITRKSGETFSHLHTRIRNMARMATRDDGAEALRNELQLSKQHFIRCLPEEHYKQFKHEERQRNARGEEDFTYAEMIIEINRIDALLNVGKTDKEAEKQRAFLAKSTAGSSRSTRSESRYDEEYTEEEGSYEDESDSFSAALSEISDMEDTLKEQVLRIWRRKGKTFWRNKGTRGARGGRRGRGGRLFKPYLSRRRRRRQRVNEVHEDESSNDVELSGDEEPTLDYSDEPVLLTEEDGTPYQCIMQIQCTGNRKRTYTPLNLTRLNVGPHECARCGLQGHYCSSKACPLGRKPIRPYPCTMCNKGGHEAKFCQRKSKN